MKSPRLPRRQRGLTLVELLVALVIGLVVVIAAIATLLVGRTGFTTVDTTSQMVDRERFAIDTISRLIAQAGFEDIGGDTYITRAVAVRLPAPLNDPEPDVFGWNDAFYTQLDNLAITTSTKIVDANRDGKCSVNDTSCKNGSDILVVRFQGSGQPADGTMVNCRGDAEPGMTDQNLDRRAANILYTARDANTGEPGLYCAYYNFTANAWVAGQQLIEGVESLQILYGTDNVTPNTAPPAATGNDTIVDRWLRADQLKVIANTAGTRENWRRVRAVRVGMVLRGAVGSAQEIAAATVNPLGAPFTSVNDKGTALAVAADGRLRRVVSFTVHIRNDLGTRS
jgi:type IV pilus assembly protein PilW